MADFLVSSNNLGPGPAGSDSSAEAHMRTRLREAEVIEREAVAATTVVQGSTGLGQYREKVERQSVGGRWVLVRVCSKQGRT